jgi:hypothetical protein
MPRKKRNLPPPTHPSKKQAVSGSGSNSYGKKKCSSGLWELKAKLCKVWEAALWGMQVRFYVAFSVANRAICKGMPTTTASNDKPQGNSYQPRQPAQARVYSLTPANNEDEEPSTDVVTGTLPLFGRLACVLFDSGATHSFISSTYVKLCNMNTKPLEQNIRVTNPVGDAVTCVKYVENCPIVIGGKTLPARLAVFSMLGFDIILGMDWLSKYGANIDCRKKEVVFRLRDTEEFKFCGSRVRATPPLLSALQARKSIRDGAYAYLAYVVAKPNVEAKLEDIPVVRHYSRCFRGGY